MIPQIIMICLTLTGLMFSAYRHGKPKDGYYSVWVDLIAVIIQLSILYFGGFFDVLIK